MNSPDTRTRIFYTAVGLIGNICAESFSLAAIDDLFIRHGANTAWKTKLDFSHLG